MHNLCVLGPTPCQREGASSLLCALARPCMHAMALPTMNTVNDFEASLSSKGVAHATGPSSCAIPGRGGLMGMLTQRL